MINTMSMREKHLVVISVIMIFISLFTYSVKSYDISDPSFTNELIEEIDTPIIEPGNEGEMSITLKNPYPDDMKNITFTVNIYWYSYVDVDEDITEVEEPPVFDNGETSWVLDIGELSNDESKEEEYLIYTSKNTEEGVYSIRCKLEFSLRGEEEVMKSRGHFSSEEWEGARNSDGKINVTELNVSGILPESTFDVRDPVPRWPQYALGLITIVSGVLAVMFYFQEKYGSFPKLEKAFDNWTSKLEEFRSRFK